MDFCSALKTAGMANIASGLGGGMVGYHTVSDTTLAYRMGAKSRLVGISTAALCVVVLMTDTSFLSFFPKPVLGAVLLFIGLSLLVEWLYDGRQKFSRLEFLSVVLILFVIGIVGLFEGVVAGIVITIILFVVEFSRSSATHYIASGANFRSNTARPLKQEQLLAQFGDRIFILGFREFLFFGTANSFLFIVQERLRTVERDPLKYIILDFQRVKGLDATTVQSFIKLKRIAVKHRLTLIFIALNQSVMTKFKKAYCFTEVDPVCRIFPDMDRALEWCEERIITFERIRFKDHLLTDLKTQLSQHFFNEEQIVRFMRYLEPMEVQRGEYLFNQGDPCDGLYFLESGVVSIWQEGPEKGRKRLRKFHQGTIIGEMGLYGEAPRSASVVAEHTSRLYFLSIYAFTKMETEDPDLSAGLHKFIARLLASRLNYRENALILN